MSGFLFFSVAPFQGRYFQTLVNEGGLPGEVVSLRQLPWPTLRGGAGVLRRVDWQTIVEEKCEERRLKRKYAGFLYRVLLRLELLLVALSIQALLDTRQPCGVAVWNGSHRYCRLLMALAPKSTKRFFFENGLLPRTTTVDPVGVNFQNSLPREPGFYLSRASADRSTAFVLTPRQSKRDTCARIALPERFIFFPFQVDSDTQIRFFSPWVKDMRELFALGERMARVCDLPVVFKEHPSSRHQYPDLHARANDRLIFANGNSTEELIRESLFVVTVNSTVGLESLLLGKRLMTLGLACYNIEGLVVHADSEQSALRLAREYRAWPLDERVRSGFIRYLSDEYCIPASWQQPDSEHVRRVVARLSG